MRFAYTGIRVSNLERSLRFYVQAMDMKQIGKGRMNHGGIYVSLKGPKSSQKLELNYYPPGTRFHERYKSGSELDHFAIWATDVDRTYKKLLTKGAKKAVKPFSEDRYRLAFVKDPDGIWIELIGTDKR